MVIIEDLKNHKEQICVVGLGYVGLPLAVVLAKHFSVIGFDIKEKRIAELNSSFDRTKEVESQALKESGIVFTHKPEEIKKAKFIIVAVPTPVKLGNVPDMDLVIKASEMVGKNLSKGAVVVFESTVFPGATEEICLRVLEKNSGLKAGLDFKIGYSPERVNPGDRQHIIEKVVKVVSGMDEETLSLVASVYGCITEVFKAKSIKVAEAAKVIENTQRDLNIALMNELAKIFSKMDISVYDVLAAANTKWNFLKFTPGLVGGHCIGVDPYYLTYKAQSLGFEPEVILAGRKTNDSMGFWMVENILEKNSISVEKIRGLKVLIAGITFKENVPDIRNSKVVDIYKSLVDKGITPDVCDPIADVEDVKAEYGIVLSELNTEKKYDLVILAVAHEEYKKCGLSYWQKYLNKGGVLADVKGVYFQEKNKVPELKYWTV